MARIQVLWGCVLGVSCLLCACGDSQDSQTPYNRTLGDNEVGAPLAAGVVDPGILADAAGYKPAEKEQGLGGGAARDRHAHRRGGGDREAEVRAVVTAFGKALGSGDVGQALSHFRPGDVAALSEDKLEKIYNTLALISETLAEELKNELGQGRAQKVLGVLGDDPAFQPTIEFPGPDHASVTPNLTVLLFGPVRASPAMVLVRENNEWKFQLESPLTDADADEIVAFHARLQEQLNEIIDWIFDAETIDQDELEQVVSQVLQGEPVEVPGADRDFVEDDADETETGTEETGTTPEESEEPDTPVEEEP